MFAGNANEKPLIHALVVSMRAGAWEYVLKLSKHGRTVGIESGKIAGQLFPGGRCHALEHGRFALRLLERRRLELRGDIFHADASLERLQDQGFHVLHLQAADLLLHIKRQVAGAHQARLATPPSSRECPKHESRHLGTDWRRPCTKKAAWLPRAASFRLRALLQWEVCIEQ